MNPILPPRRSAHWRALFGALALFGLMLGALSCGGDDLVFPGEVPNTPTSVPTATSTPTS